MEKLQKLPEGRIYMVFGWVVAFTMGLLLAACVTHSPLQTEQIRSNLSKLTELGQDLNHMHEAYCSTSNEFLRSLLLAGIHSIAPTYPAKGICEEFATPKQLEELIVKQPEEQLTPEMVLEGLAAPQPSE